jgi:hypothetical protein
MKNIIMEKFSSNFKSTNTEREINMQLNKKILFT